MEGRSFLETSQDVVESFDEPIAPTNTPLFVPARRGADFGPCLRMKIDPHDGG